MEGINPVVAQKTPNIYIHVRLCGHHENNVFSTLLGLASEGRSQNHALLKDMMIPSPKPQLHHTFTGVDCPRVRMINGFTEFRLRNTQD
jgi:hypothetical protein